jgi:hypothetical protein
MVYQARKIFKATDVYSVKYRFRISGENLRHRVLLFFFKIPSNSVIIPQTIPIQHLFIPCRILYVLTVLPIDATSFRLRASIHNYQQYHILGYKAEWEQLGPAKNNLRIQLPVSTDIPHHLQTRWIKTHHITTACITTHRLNNLNSKDLNLYLFLTYICIN